MKRQINAFANVNSISLILIGTFVLANNTIHLKTMNKKIQPMTIKKHPSVIEPPLYPGFQIKERI